jgi:hypothetical protein
MPRTLTTEEVVARRTRMADLRIAASTSFTEEEILALDTILTTMLRGGDTRTLAAAPIQQLSKKMPSMKAAVARQKERRKAIGG